MMPEQDPSSFPYTPLSLILSHLPSETNDDVVGILERDWETNPFPPVVVFVLNVKAGCCFYSLHHSVALPLRLLLSPVSNK